MNTKLQRQLVDRVLAHLDARTTDSNAAMSTVPIAAYADAARIDRERERLFRELPLIVGHVSQVPNPGDYFTHDASGVPLIVSRGDDGELHAMLNVCRHRGTRVESANCGTRRAFVCPYHAWSYGRDGALIGVPHERAFVARVSPNGRSNGAPSDAPTSGVSTGAPNDVPCGVPSGAPSALPREARGLVGVPLGVSAGLIFVRPTPTAPGEDRHLDAGTWLGSLAADFEGFGLPTASVYAPLLVERALSWKLAVDVFLESYHVRTTHANTIYRMFFDNVGLVDPVGPHLRNVFPKRSIRELAGTQDGLLRHHANVLYHLFPNTLILVEPDHVAVLHLWPVDATRTRLQAYMLVPEQPVTEKARRYWDANNELLLGAIDEDFTMGESIQRGIASGANTHLTFGAFEHALAHFHAQVEWLSCR